MPMVVFLMTSNNDFILHPDYKFLVPRRDFHVVRPGDTAESIAAMRAADFDERVRRFEATKARLTSQWIAKGRDPRELEFGIFDAAAHVADHQRLADEAEAEQAPPAPPTDVEPRARE